MKVGDMVRAKREPKPSEQVGIITWASWISKENQPNYWMCHVLWGDGRHVSEDAWDLQVVSGDDQ